VAKQIASVLPWEGYGALCLKKLTPFPYPPLKVSDTTTTTTTTTHPPPSVVALSIQFLKRISHSACVDSSLRAELATKIAAHGLAIRDSAPDIRRRAA
jgi:hypothetical protein